MKKIYFLALISCFSWFSGAAKHVPAEDAQRVAANFFSQVAPTAINGKSQQTLNLVHQEVSKQINSNSRQTPFTFYYVFASQPTGGLVFISADDNVKPVLGYTRTGTFNTAKMPTNLAKWLEGYKNEIRFAAKQNNSNEKTKRAWKALQEGTAPYARTHSTLAASVDPLVSTTWDQSPYYNELCPYDNDANDRAVTGCVATAMAQIMRYWKYPARGSGFHSYNHEKYGTLSANFSNTTYDWDNMPNSINGSNTAIATLMRDVGISVDMSYGVGSTGGSSAYVISAASQGDHNSEYALKTYFGYEDVKGVQRRDYSDSEWINLMKTELDNGQPILYAGFGNGGGHAFVCDGYDQNDLFHMNWGWSGYYDGFFALSALNPDGQGTGGGTGSYNSNQQALIGIKAPNQNPNEEIAELELYDDVTISTPVISFGHPFTVHTDIHNNGKGTFKGEYGAAAFDENGNFIDFIQTIAEDGLAPDYHYTDGLTFKTEGMVSLLPGVYDLYIFHKAEGQWVQLKGGNFYSDHVTLEVINQNNLNLYEEVAVQKPKEVYQGKKIAVSTFIQNVGKASFNGIVALNLYDLEGNFAFEIGQKQVDQLCKNCKTGEVVFTNDKLDVEPGTYLMAVLHYTDTDKWRITGSEDYVNPIRVVVQAAPIGGDKYEENNTVEDAAPLALNFTGNTAKVTTPQANIHVGTDYDYYKITLPAGRKYEISARVNDSYESKDGKTYTNDVLFSLSDDGENWTDAYDQEMETVEVEGGKTIYASVSPYFQGETGTYALEITLKQSQVTGTKDDYEELAVQAYPNPTSGVLHLHEKKEYTRYELTNLTGKVIMTVPKGTAQVDISTLPNGVYLLRTLSKTGYQVQKIVKQ
ncbi:thiol protease/hemagglutinin PrtT [Adhaeribacter radiodurans]|uniref:Thiol protease/hemagglutinin PrtT n=1 Tax=Adhaeribacter radiodurans TaxID=2745197 RepID=A0A7L7L6E3_9BACT|nr:thiol protease/hemagglutinin PrtT [Adhaeribacter radiodurans]QMU28075.1 thiol protease/hemagglutinin PrtT [Adhaeribacter radiodurans]